MMYQRLVESLGAGYPSLPWASSLTAQAGEEDIHDVAEDEVHDVEKQAEDGHAHQHHDGGAAHLFPAGAGDLFHLPAHIHVKTANARGEVLQAPRHAAPFRYCRCHETVTLVLSPPRRKSWWWQGWRDSNPHIRFWRPAV